jgi:large subunit ribosomal protein L3
MPNTCPGLLGRKIGMTQLFDKNNHIVPVTVIDVSGNTVTQIKKGDGADGYNAIQLGIDTRKTSQSNKALDGHFAKAQIATPQWAREIRLQAKSVDGYSAGQTLSADDVFTGGEKVDVTGTSKGKGFAGVMKKYNFAGFIRSHGTHEFFRHGGSIGCRLTPGHVLKGKKMPGQMGAERVTVQNLTVARIDSERGLLFIKGGIPGANGGYVMVRKAIKA